MTYEESDEANTRQKNILFGPSTVRRIIGQHHGYLSYPQWPRFSSIKRLRRPSEQMHCLSSPINHKLGPLSMKHHQNVSKGRTKANNGVTTQGARKVSNFYLASCNLVDSVPELSLPHALQRSQWALARTGLYPVGTEFFLCTSHKGCLEAGCNSDLQLY